MMIDSLVNNMEHYLQGSIILSLVAAFAGGLLASFTPCVYTMIPITEKIISNRNLGGSKLKSLLLSFYYVTGMAVTYSAMGRVCVPPTKRNLSYFREALRRL